MELRYIDLLNQRTNQVAPTVDLSAQADYSSISITPTATPFAQAAFQSPLSATPDNVTFSSTATKSTSQVSGQSSTNPFASAQSTGTASFSAENAQNAFTAPSANKQQKSAENMRLLGHLVSEREKTDPKSVDRAAAALETANKQAKVLTWMISHKNQSAGSEEQKSFDDKDVAASRASYDKAVGSTFDELGKGVQQGSETHKALNNLQTNLNIPAEQRDGGQKELDSLGNALNTISGMQNSHEKMGPRNAAEVLTTLRDSQMKDLLAFSEQDLKKSDWQQNLVRWYTSQKTLGRKMEDILNRDPASRYEPVFNNPRFQPNERSEIAKLEDISTGFARKLVNDPKARTVLGGADDPPSPLWQSLEKDAATDSQGLKDATVKDLRIACVEGAEFSAYQIMSRPKIYNNINENLLNQKLGTRQGAPAVVDHLRADAAEHMARNELKDWMKLDDKVWDAEKNLQSSKPSRNSPGGKKEQESYMDAYGDAARKADDISRKNPQLVKMLENHLRSSGHWENFQAQAERGRILRETEEKAERERIAAEKAKKEKEKTMAEALQPKPPAPPPKPTVTQQITTAWKTGGQKGAAVANFLNGLSDSFAK
jgi:hypothetical protein